MWVRRRRGHEKHRHEAVGRPGLPVAPWHGDGCPGWGCADLAGTCTRSGRQSSARAKSASAPLWRDRQFCGVWHQYLQQNDCQVTYVFDVTAFFSFTGLPPVGLLTNKNDISAPWISLHEQRRVGFIDAHRDARGAKPVCSVLRVALSTCYEHLPRRGNPSRLPDPACRDEALRPDILRVLEENWRGYGIGKIWRQLGRAGFDVARCTLARLMKGMDIAKILRFAQIGPQPGPRHIMARASSSLASIRQARTA